VLEEVMDGLMQNLKLKRKEYLFRCKKIEDQTSFIAKYITPIKQKFIGEKILQEIDHEAKKIAEIDSSLIIAATIKNFEEMYQPEEVESNDIFAVKLKVSIISKEVDSHL
jgi:hypothetical protein